jgi:Leucine-rich repeat (LRR) protein
MDKESYKKIKALISSNDDTNVELGIELMKSLKGPLLYPFMQKLARKDEYLLLAINAELEEGLKRLQVQQIRVANRNQELPPMQLGQSIGALKDLEVIDLQNLNLQNFPDSIGQLTKLKEISMNNNAIRHLPESIVNLERLKILNLTNNPIERLPEAFGNLEKLRELNLSGTNLKELPASIANCKRLEFFNLANVQPLERLPPELFMPLQLSSIYVGNTAIKELPENIELKPKDNYQYITLQIANTKIKSLSPILNMKTNGAKGTMNIYKAGCEIFESEIQAIQSKFQGTFNVIIRD